MPALRTILQRYRLVGAAVLASFALHAAVMVGMPKRLGAVDERTEAIYSATLDALATPATLAPASAPAATPTARPSTQRTVSRTHAPRHRTPPSVEALAAQEPLPRLEPMASLATDSIPDLPPIESL